MKRILAIFTSLLLLAGCSEMEEKTGYVGYIYYTLDASSLEKADIKLIDTIYTVEFKQISNAVVEDGHIYMYGKYGELDKQVLEACRKAEDKISGLPGFPMKGKYRFTVNAVYTMNVVSDFYVKVY